MFAVSTWLVHTSRNDVLRRKISPLFRYRDQQDSHECLRCILHYIQELTQAINRQRAVYQDVTRPDGANAGHSVSHSVLENSSANHTDIVSVASETVVTTSTVLKVSTPTPHDDCLISSSRRSSGSSEKPAAEETKPSGTVAGSAVDAKKPSAIGKITGYFAAAPPAPKTVADVTVTTGKVSDFVGAMCEGKCRRSTRCLECEGVTECTESFQDVEVVAQKAVRRLSDSDTEDDDGMIYLISIHYSSSYEYSYIVLFRLCGCCTGIYFCKYQSND